MRWRAHHRGWQRRVGDRARAPGMDDGRGPSMGNCSCTERWECWRGGRDGWVCRTLLGVAFTQNRGRGERFAWGMGVLRLRARCCELGAPSDRESALALPSRIRHGDAVCTLGY